ncbi:hypothetical protein C4J81_12895 [Deltaproteobacteria bacterium Smac51]|nr:hypothetical protein C4J81_12895 [Deltaproteobacteria bacterium Smac51]
MAKIYWVGVRSSEVQHVPVFSGSVTVLGEGKNNKSFKLPSGARVNHNDAANDSAITDFLRSSLHAIIQEDPAAEFMFYNPLNAHKFGPKIAEKTICLNSANVLQALNEKLITRTWFSNYCKSVPCTALSGADCNYDFLKSIFEEADQFVIQKNTGSGGFGTFLLDNKADCPGRTALADNTLYVVAPYLESAISINSHIVVYKNTAVTLPPSIQLIIPDRHNQLLYRGADFIAYKQLSSALHNKVRKISLTIGEQLRRAGYLGIAGLDFLIHEQDVYLSEINPRFQASTPLLNQALKQAGRPTVQEMTLRSFAAETAEEFTSLDVPYSNYYYLSSDCLALPLLSLYAEQSELTIDYDGYNKEQQTEDEAFLFRVNFPYNIAGIASEGAVNIHDNIIGSSSLTAEPFFTADKKRIKIELLNQGVRLSKSAKNELNRLGGVREGVFSAVDIDIFDGLKVNCPYEVKLTQFSPYEIDYQNNQLVLTHGGKLLTTVKMESDDSLYSQTTSSGIRFSQFSSLVNDRLRVNHSAICRFRTAGKSCAFCNLPSKRPTYGLKDICEAVDKYLDERNFRHFLIGGSSDENETERITAISEYIKSVCDKPIYVMCLPDKSRDDLQRLRDSGVDEIAFNIEVFDEETAKEIMPGKGHISRRRYFEALGDAVDIWGKGGEVKSIIVVGLEPRKLVVEGVTKLCQIGVQPILSAFRPLEESRMGHCIPPSSAELLSLHDELHTICCRYGQILGPACEECQNNTISFPDGY